MRLSQVALHSADNGGRIGNGTVLSVKKIRETDINDILTGAGLQAGSLDLYANGRIVLSSLAQVKDSGGKVIADRYYIHWQRCMGSNTHTPKYGPQGKPNQTNISTLRHP